MSDSTLMTPPATTTEGAVASTTEATTATTPPAGTTPPADTATTQQTGATTPAEGDEPAVEGDKPGEAKPAGAPEKYEFKAPEGQSFDAGVLGTFEQAARELNLTQEGAQSMLDKLAPALAEKQQRIAQEMRTGWETASKTDKEFGGDKLTENLGVAQKALKQFGSPELQTLLNDSGLGNHPEVIRLLYRAGKAISEDTFVSGSSGKPSSNDARGLYPNSNMK